MRVFAAFATLIVFLFVASAASAQKPIEGEGFIYQPPSGWNVVRRPESPNPITFGKPEGRFAPNINVLLDPYKADMPSYVKRNVDEMARVLDKFRKVSEAPFQTRSGIRGVRMISQSRTQNTELRYVTYFLPAKEKPGYFVVTYSCLLKDGARFDKLVDESVRTFTYRKAL